MGICLGGGNLKLLTFLFLFLYSGSATSSLGGVWDQIFLPRNPNPSNFTSHVELQLVATGRTQSFPKYEIGEGGCARGKERKGKSERESGYERSYS